jgi:glycerophosphoryl diester phosphodiesterase
MSFLSFDIKMTKDDVLHILHQTLMDATMMLASGSSEREREKERERERM